MTLTANELKAYVPARDFEVSKAFYRSLGFEVTDAWGGDVDCRLGNVAFRLQNYYKKEWADNFMMLFDVDDVRAWHAHAKPIIETGDFGSARLDEPEVVDEDTIIMHIWDPSGVLLIFAQ